jgi:hypothetical protein
MNGFSTASAIGTVAAFIVTAAGGATIAAETSVPGDAFYAVKRSVNEPFRESLAFGAAANADIEGDLAVRRLGEINSLAAQNRLDEETRVQLSEEFKAHAEASTRFAVQAGEEGNADAAADVTASIAQTYVSKRRNSASTKRRTRTPRWGSAPRCAPPRRSAPS